jgi:hypothetical protein
MKLQLSLLDDFGTQLGDGDLAAKYRIGRIDPYVNLCEEIVLDFSGVRTGNSSFVNALVAGLVEHHGEPVLKLLTFKGCNPVLQVLVESAIDLGLQKFEARVGA